jgi:hypothetical protein
MTHNSPDRTIILNARIISTASKTRQPRYESQIAKKYHSLPELRLNIQPPLLRQNQHIPIIITKSLPFHRGVGEIHMDSEPFAQRRITIASDRFQPIYEVHFGGIWWKIEGMPSELGRANVHFWVEWKETGFKLQKPITL